MGLIRYNSLPYGTDIDSVPLIEGQVVYIPVGVSDDGNLKVYEYHDYRNEEGELRRALVANSTAGSGGTAEKSVTWVDPMTNATRDMVKAAAGSESICFFKDVQFTVSEAPERNASVHYSLLYSSLGSNNISIIAQNGSSLYRTGSVGGAWIPWVTPTFGTKTGIDMNLDDMITLLPQAPIETFTIEGNFITSCSPDGSATSKWYVDSIVGTENIIVKASNGKYEYNNIYDVASEDWSGWIRTDGGDKLVYDSTVYTAKTRELLRAIVEDAMKNVQGTWEYVFTSAAFTTAESPDGSTSAFNVEFRKLSDGIYHVIAKLGAQNWVTDYTNNAWSDWVEEASILNSVQHYPTTLTGQTRANLVSLIPAEVIDLDNFIYYYDDVTFTSAEAPFSNTTAHYVVQLFKNNNTMGMQVASIETSMFISYQVNATSWSPWVKQLLNRASDGTTIYIPSPSTQALISSVSNTYIGTVTDESDDDTENCSLGEVTHDQTLGVVNYSVALGYDSEVDGCSVAIGDTAVAKSHWFDDTDPETQWGGIAIGCEAKAQVKASDDDLPVGGIGIGDNVNADGGIAIGHNTTAVQNTLVIGSNVEMGEDPDRTAALFIGFHGSGTSIELEDTTGGDRIELKSGSSDVLYSGSVVDVYESNVDIDADVTVSADTTVNSQTDIDATVDIDGAVDIDDALTIKGATTVDTGSSVTVGNASSSKTAAVSIMGNTTQNGTYTQAAGSVYIGTATSSNPTVYIDGDTTVAKGGVLNVKGTVKAIDEYLEFGSTAGYITLADDTFEVSSGGIDVMMAPDEDEPEKGVMLIDTDGNKIHPWTDGIKQAPDFDSTQTLNDGDTLIYNLASGKFRPGTTSTATTTFEEIFSGNNLSAGVKTMSKSSSLFSCLLFKIKGEILGTLYYADTVLIPNNLYGTGTGIYHYSKNISSGYINISEVAGNSFKLGTASLSNVQIVVYGVTFRTQDIDEPIGTIKMYAGTSAPTGFLICDGSAISRTTYSDLFAIIGTSYGSGDGSTTFNLPNLVNKFAEGRGAGAIDSSNPASRDAGLPNITGSMAVNFPTYQAFDSEDGALRYHYGGQSGYRGSTNSPFGDVSFNASNSNPVYGNSDTVQPASCRVQYIIKY